MTTDQFQRSGAVALAPEPEAVTGEVVPSEAKLAEIQQARTADIDPFVGAAKAITIEDSEDAEGATEVLAEIQRRKKRLETERKSLVEPVNEAKSRIQNLFNKLKAPLDEARDILEPKLIAFQDAEDRRIREANAQAEREAQAKRAAEQKRIDDERAAAAQVARDAAEAARKASEALSETDASNTGEAEAEALAAADAARKAAEDLAAKRDERPTFELAEREEAVTTVQTASGSATRRKVWTGEVVDESQVPRQYMTVDQKKINAAVKAGEREIPGVKIYEKASLAVKA